MDATSKISGDASNESEEYSQNSCSSEVAELEQDDSEVQSPVVNLSGNKISFNKVFFFLSCT